jgi:glycosyltransferase involved in cell wall biosynthesis
VKPKVLYVGPTPPPHNGMTTVTLAFLASPVLNASYRVLHLDTSDRRDTDNMGRLEPGNVLLGLRHAAALAGMLVRHRPNLVYVPVSQNRWAYVRDSVLMGLCRLARVRLLTHLHGGGFRDFYDSTDRATRWLVRVTSGWLDGAVVLGDGLRRMFEGLVAEERIHVIPNGVSDPFPEGVPVRRRSEPPRVTYLGTLIRSKGVPDLLRVAGRLKEDGVRATFVFAGGWNSEAERAEALELVEHHELDGMVEFAGVVSGESKRRLLADADVLVLPTRYAPEGQPLVILEAMAAGLPVISTARAAIPDMLADGVNGVLVPEGDDTALADAVRRLVESPAERSAMGAAGRARYLEAFTEDRMMGKVGVVIDRVLAAAS